MQQTIKSLKHMKVSYDSDNSVLSLHPLECFETGRQFQAPMAAGSGAHESLYELMTNLGLADRFNLAIAEKLELCSKAATTVAGLDPRVHICIGEGIGYKPVELDLRENGHCIVYGNSGSGKSVFQRLFLIHGQSHEQIELWGIDIRGFDLSPYFEDYPERLARTLEEAVLLVHKLEEILRQRKRLLAGRNFLGSELPAIYFVVEELYRLSELAYEPYQLEELKMAKELMAALERIAAAGTEEGLFLILSAQRPDFNIVSAQLKSSIPTAIIMGRMDFGAMQLAVQGRLHYGPAHLSNRGRALVDHNGQQTLVQTYHWPWDRR